MIKNNKKGSLTVEAAISLPFFLLFFLLLLFVIKTACNYIILDHAVAQIAKQLAISAYPLSYLNELEDSLMDVGDKTIPSFESEKAKLQTLLTEEAEGTFEKLLTADMDKKDISNLLESIGTQITNDYIQGIKGYIVNKYAKNYYDIKVRIKYLAVKTLIEQFTKNIFINSNNIKLQFIELPRSNSEYLHRQSDSTYQFICNQMGIDPGQDDVVVAIEYKSSYLLPFIGSGYITTRHIAMEKAWIHGNYGIYTITDELNTDDKNAIKDQFNDTDFDDYEKDNADPVFYITRTGEKYHKNGCMYLARSKIPIKLSEAVKRGSSPCKVCVTKTAKHLRRK